MQIPNDAILLRIFLGESDKWQHKPLYEAIGHQLVSALAKRSPD